MPDKLVHQILIKYSDGSKGTYIGVCPFDPNDVDKISIASIEISQPESVSEAILEQVRNDVIEDV